MSKLIDKFFMEPHADGATYFAQRGKTRIQAVDWDEETDKLYPVVPEMDRARERDWGFKQVEREEVPDRIEEFFENQFVSPEELDKALKSVGDNSKKTSEGDNK